jgi:hypothetical protein
VDEVLAVEADDERRDEEDRGDRTESLDDLVLVDRDPGLLVITGRGEQVAGVFDALRRPEELVEGRAELLLDLARKDLACEQRSALDVDAPVDDLPDRVARRGQSLADVQQVAPELRDPPAYLLGRPGVDPLLELLDLVVERVQQVEVALRDVVDQEVGDRPRRVLVGNRVACVGDVARVERLPAAGRLADRDDSVAAEDEIDLLVIDDILFGHRDCCEQHAEDVVPVALDARPRHAAVRVGRPHQFTPGVRAQLVRDVLAQLLLVRVEEIGPGASRYAARVKLGSARPLPRAGRSERAPPLPRRGAAPRRARPSRPSRRPSRLGDTYGRRRPRQRTRP